MTSAERLANDMLDDFATQPRSVHECAQPRTPFRAADRLLPLWRWLRVGLAHSRRAAHLAAPLVLIAIAATAAHAQVNIKSGYYDGNSVDNRAITGLGFQPDVVIVKSHEGDPATMRTADMPSNRSKHLHDGAGLAQSEIFDGKVRVSVILENGTRLEQVYDVLAKSRFTIPVGAFFPGAMGAKYGVMVESIGASPAQIIVERATYSDAVDATDTHTAWAAGTGALGTRIR
jgi:hypothetical protein